MGQQQSKNELLYQQVVEGNAEAIKALHRDGAELGWMDENGRTPLIVACMSPERFIVAKTLIELGANVNAYRRGRHAGTPLHHAAKKGLDQTVQLLLSHGANPLVRNDDCQTPLDVARTKGFSNVVHTIESRICFFSGWLREFYGPGFLEALAPQLLSRKIWVVITPCSSHNPTKPLKLELVIYSTSQDAQPHSAIALWKANIEEPKFDQSDPSLIIFDKSTKTRYRFASSNNGDKQQLQWLYNAIRGIPQVMPSVTHNTQFLVPPSPTRTSAEAVEFSMGINTSIQPALERTSPAVPNNHPSSGTNNANGWGSTTNESTHNGWGSSDGSTPSKTSSGGWMEKPTTKEYNGWGNTTDDSSHNGLGSSGGPTPLEASSSGWMHKPAKEEYNGWGNTTDDSSHNGWGSFGKSTHSEASSSRWMDKPAKTEFNGWGIPESSLISSPIQHTQILDNILPSVQVNEIPELVSSFPSAPPVPEEGFDEGPIRYPSIDFTPVEYGVSRSSEAKDENGSSSCVICWESPVEGACIPCGHMAGCMTCLNEIKSKKGDCPVCRAKIDQVVRLYAV